MYSNRSKCGNNKYTYSFNTRQKIKNLQKKEEKIMRAEGPSMIKVNKAPRRTPHDINSKKMVPLAPDGQSKIIFGTSGREIENCHPSYFYYYKYIYSQ